MNILNNLMSEVSEIQRSVIETQAAAGNALDERNKLVLKLHSSGATQTELAKAFGIAQTTVSKILRAAKQG
jgi:DNA-directed RNA polymerase specialized sigma subunit